MCGVFIYKEAIGGLILAAANSSDVNKVDWAVCVLRI